MTFGPLHRISPSSAIFISTPSMARPTQPNLFPLFASSETVITGEDSVIPYPSAMVIPAAENTLAKRGCKAALPELINSRLPPKASFHLEKMSLRAIASFIS